MSKFSRNKAHSGGRLLAAVNPYEGSEMERMPELLNYAMLV